MAGKLTFGFVKKVYGKETGVAQSEAGVLQVHELRKLSGATGVATSTRYRVGLSDGQFTLQCMLATQLNHMVDDGSLRVGGIVRLREYLMNPLQGRKICIVLGLDVVETEAKPIGNPRDFSEASASGPSPAGAPRPTGAMGAARRAGGPTTHAPVGGDFVPLSHLNPYSNRWRIKARVTQKSAIRTWNKGPDNTGSLFSVTLLDGQGTEMRATFFREAVEKFHDMLNVGDVYTFSQGRLKAAWRGQGYEINFDSRAEVEAVGDDAGIQEQVFNFVELSKLPEVKTGDVVDVVAVVTDAQPFAVIQSKTGRELTKRDLEVMDQSGTCVRVTLWDDMAKTEDAKFANNPVVALKGVRTSDYGGISLSSVSTTQITWSPNVDEAHQLRQWFDAGGAQSAAKTVLSSSTGGGGNRGGPLAETPMAERETLDKFHKGGVGMNDKPDFMRVRVCLSMIKHDPVSYPSCPEKLDATRICRKKVTLDGSSGWFCERCQRVVTPVYRYIMSCSAIDWTGTQWMTMFDEEAEKLLGVSADQLQSVKDADEGQAGAMIEAKYFTDMVALVKAKMEQRNDDEPRLRTVISGFQPVDYAKESKLLIDALQEMGL